MPHTVETRVAVVEMTQKHHASEIEQLKIEVRSTGEKLECINRQLSQIKWIAIGYIGTRVAEQAGIFGFLHGILL